MSPTNDNHEKVITQIIAALSYNPQAGTMAELRRIITKYAEIERKARSQGCFGESSLHESV